MGERTGSKRMHCWKPSTARKKPVFWRDMELSRHTIGAILTIRANKANVLARINKYAPKKVMHAKKAP
jgi:hypothetical protein